MLFNALLPQFSSGEVATTQSSTGWCAVQRTVLAVALGLTLAAAPAWADEYSDVSRFIRAGQLTEATTAADRYLVGKPRDAQMRFLKGVILTEQNKANDAIAVFVKLTEDFPELPEPYNNLAVLYGQQGLYDKARAALEMAIRTNPSYATAHENLGDVYAKLSSQSYAKALQLDPNNAAVAPKLTVIRELFGASKGRPAAPVAAATPATVAPALKPPAVAPATQAPAATPAVAPVAPPPKVAPVAVPPAPVPAPPPIAAAAGSAEVEAAVREWAAAWSARDVKRYLGAYGRDFDPPGKVARAAWEAERKTRILGKNSIRVGISNMTISVNGANATAKFRQDYKADSLDVSAAKCGT